ncbi:hypothetical protein AABB24_026950 [Solanum stoloniferum]|uniref:C2H2-type domain-containing protein n=1 Tax=Solanum stoloniferum TaxID=62892 RepID=A0ABD2SH01_9SOLN
MINEDRVMENAIQRELQYKQKIANLFPGHDAIDVLPLEVKRWKALISKRNISTDGRTDCSQTTTTCKYESDEDINARGNISRSNSNVKRRKALISKNRKSDGRVSDCGAPTCIHNEVSQETFKHLESDGQSIIVKSITSPPRPSLSPTYTYSRRKKNAESSNSGFVSLQQQHTTNVMHYCKDCEVYCSGDLCYEQHLRGNKHKVKLQCRGHSSVNGKNKQVIRCDLCEIYCQDETLLKMHLKGQKHKAKQHEMEHGKKIKDEKGKLLWCELCQVPCMNEDNFTAHRNGKKHRRQLCVLEELKKAEPRGLYHA